MSDMEVRVDDRQEENEDSLRVNSVVEQDRRAYSAPALEKGLDILEALCLSEKPLSQKDIAQKLGRSIGEIYRMLSCLTDRNYITQVDDNCYVLTTKLYELVHRNPPTHRLLQEATSIMQRLSGELDQSCHLTVWAQGKQVVVYKVDSPSGMGFSVRIGAELDALVSASGRVLIAFQDKETSRLRVEEARRHRPDQYDPQLESVLAGIRKTGFESVPSVQVRGLYAISFPIFDAQGHALAALTVPFAERIDLVRRKSIPEVTAILAQAARTLSARMGGMVSS